MDKRINLTRICHAGVPFFRSNVVHRSVSMTCVKRKCLKKSREKCHEREIHVTRWSQEINCVKFLKKPTIRTSYSSGLGCEKRSRVRSRDKSMDVRNASDCQAPFPRLRASKTLQMRPVVVADDKVHCVYVLCMYVCTVH